MASQQEQALSVIQYGQGFAVFGDTKPWKENLKSMGGKYNGFLRPYGQEGEAVPGWIFGKNKGQELREFVDQANAGEIQQMAFVGKQPASARVRAAAGPSARFQSIVYEKVPLPYVGQGVTLSVPDEEEKMLKVTELHHNGFMVDVISLKNPSVTEEFWTGAVVAGRWEIIDFGKDHSLTFH